jgi:hypothetical protein
MGTEGYIAQPRVGRNRFFDVCACVVMSSGRDAQPQVQEEGEEKQGGEVCGGGGDLRVTDN